MRTLRLPTHEPLLVMLLMGIAILLRVRGIDREGLWSDELFGVLQSYKPHFTDIVPALQADSHPPGYLGFMYFTLPWAGMADWQIRLHSLVAGVLLVPVVYLTGRRFINAPAGLLAAAMVVCSYSAIYYSQEARAYAMLALFSTIHFYYFLAIFLEQETKVGNYLGFVFSGIATVYLHYAGVVFVGCEGVFCLLSVLCERRKELLVSMLYAFTPIVLSFVPWMGVMYRHMTGVGVYWGDHRHIGRDDWYDVAQFVAGYNELFVGVMTLVALVAGLYASVAIRFSPPAGRAMQHKTLLLLLYMAIAPVMVFYIKSSVSQVVFQNRHFIAAIPLAALVVSYLPSLLMMRIGFPWLRTVSVLALSIIVGYYQARSNEQVGLYSQLFRDPIREAAQVVARDRDFLAQSLHPVYMSHGGFYHYLRQYGVMTDANDDVYTEQHCRELLPRWQAAGAKSVYYLTIGPHEHYPFFGELARHRRLLCQSQLRTRSGVVTVSKFDLLMAPASQEQIVACDAVAAGPAP